MDSIEVVHRGDSEVDTVLELGLPIEFQSVVEAALAHTIEGVTKVKFAAISRALCILIGEIVVGHNILTAVEGVAQTYVASPHIEIYLVASGQHRHTYV